MRKKQTFILSLLLMLILTACGTAYKAKPLPFKAPDSFPNAQKALGIIIAANA